MNAKQKHLLVAAADLLSGLSTGTLDRAIRLAEGRKGGGNSSTVCVSAHRIKDLHAAVEALWPGLVARSHEIHVQWIEKANKEYYERQLIENQKIEKANAPLREEFEKFKLEQYRKVTGQCH